MTTTAPVTAPAWTAERMNRALWAHFNQQSWAVLFEFAGRSDEKAADGRRIDLLLIRKAGRMGIGHTDMLAIEVKVTRADFLQDVRRPEKQAAWRDTAHRHAYAVPAGLVRPEEVPAGSGLIEVEWNPPPSWSPNGGGSHSVRWALKVPYSGHRDVPAWLIRTMAWRLSWAEAQMRGYSGAETRDDGTRTAEDLRAQLANQTRRAEKEASRADREHARAKLWRSLAGAMSGLPCSTCGEMVRASRLNRRSWGGVVWVHVDPAHEEPCAPRRVAAADAKAREHDAKYGLPFRPTQVTPDPHPADDTEEDPYL